MNVKIETVSNKYILRDKAMRNNDIYSLLWGFVGVPVDAGVDGVSATEIEDPLLFSTSINGLIGFRIP